MHVQSREGPCDFVALLFAVPHEVQALLPGSAKHAGLATLPATGKASAHPVSTALGMAEFRYPAYHSSGLASGLACWTGQGCLLLEGGNEEGGVGGGCVCRCKGLDVYLQSCMSGPQKAAQILSYCPWISTRK